MIRQRNTRRVVEAASSPVVAAAAAAVHTNPEQPKAMEFGVVNTVEEEEEEELDQYFRHLVPSSMSSMPDAPTPSPSKFFFFRSDCCTSIRLYDAVAFPTVVYIHSTNTYNRCFFYFLSNFHVPNSSTGKIEPSVAVRPDRTVGRLERDVHDNIIYSPVDGGTNSG